MKKSIKFSRRIYFSFIMLTTLSLLLFGICAKAQVDNQISKSRASTTFAKGDINEDGKVDAADVVALVEIIMKGNGEEGYDQNPIYYPDVVKNQYKSQFVKTFGMPSPNQDWGFKSAVNGLTSASTFRVIAEDLVSNDFDFNDVVFDVEKKDNKLKITVLAVGTTVAMRIFGSEVHELFGVANDEMVNTGFGSNNLSPVSFEVNANIGDVFVHTDVRNNLLVQLWATTGGPTSMIAVNTDYEWCYERQAINIKYPDFASWVQGSAQSFY